MSTSRAPAQDSQSARRAREARRRKRQESSARTHTPEPKDIVSGAGLPLDVSLRRELEEQLGHDFSRVRLHTDRDADALTEMLGADAVAVGQDIFFREGAYRPGTADGQRLLAHELLHTVQNPDGLGALRAGRDLGAVSLPAQPVEREAEAAAQQSVQDSVTESPASDEQQRQAEVERDQGTPGWLRYATVNADRTRMEQLDPATLVDRLANGVQRSLRGDPTDASKRVRLQLGRMSPDLREAVLDRLEIRLLTAEYNQVLDLADEVEAGPFGFPPADTPQPLPAAIDLLEGERASEREAATGERTSKKAKDDDARTEKQETKDRAEKRDQEQSRAQQDSAAEEKEGAERQASEDERARERQDSADEQQQADEQQAKEREEADQADERKQQEQAEGADKAKEERKEQREREEKDPEQANEPGADKRKSKDDATKRADGSKQEDVDPKGKKQPGPVRPDKVDEQAERRDSPLSEHGLHEQDEDEGDPREEEQPIGLEAGADGDIGGSPDDEPKAGAGKGEAALKPEDYLPDSDLDVSSVPTADQMKPGAAPPPLPTFPAPPPTKAEQVQQERENEAEEEEDEDGPETEAKAPGEERGPVEGEAPKPVGGPAAEAPDRTEKDLQPEKPLDQEVGPDPEATDKEQAEPENEEKADPEKQQDQEGDGAKTDKKEEEGTGEDSAGEEEPDAKQAQDEQQEEKEQADHQAERDAKGRADGTGPVATGSRAAGPGADRGVSPPAGAHTEKTPAEDRRPSPAVRRAAESPKSENEAPKPKSSVTKESGPGAAPSGPVGRNDAAGAPAVAVGPGGAAPGAPAAVSPVAEQTANPGKTGAPAPEGAKPAPEASLEKDGGGCAPPEPAAEEKGKGGCAGGGGGQAKEEKEEEPPDVSEQEPQGALNTVSKLPPDQAQAALPGVDKAGEKKVKTQRKKLAANPPKRERPSGAPQTQSAPPKAAAPAPAETGKVEKVGPEPEGEKQRAKGSEKAQGAKPTENVARPRITPGKDGKISAGDADSVEAAADQVPTTDPELRNKTVGPAPKIKLEGESDPKRTDKQAKALKKKQGKIQQTGREDSSKPMGEDKIFPNAPKEQLTGKAPGGGGGGGGGGGVRAGGRAKRHVGIVAKQERGGEIKGGAGEARTQLASKEKEQQQGEQQAKREKQSEIDREVAQNAEKQTAERGRTAEKAQVERKTWRDEQDKKIKDADGKTEKEHTSQNKKITKTRDDKDKEVGDRKDKDNKGIDDERVKAEKDAEKKKEEEKGKSDSLLGKLVDAIGDFFTALLDAVTKIFDAARKAVNGIIDKFKEWANKAIDWVREQAIKAINALADALIAIGDVLLAAFPELRDKFRKAIEGLRDKAIAAVNALADGLKKAVNALLDALAAGLNALLDVLEAGIKLAINIYKAVIVGALKFAQAAIEALGKFAALVADIAPDPGGWLSKAGSAAKTGIQEHLWGEIKIAVKDWFNTKVEGILGLGKAVINVLIKGCLSIKQIAKMAWDAIIASLPMIIASVVIEKVISMLMPAAGAVLTIVQGLMAAYQSLSQILAAFGKFWAFLTAVKGGEAACAFAVAVAAGVVALLEFITNFLMIRLSSATKGVGKKLKAMAQKIMKGLKKKGKGARKAAGDAVNRARGAARKAAQALKKKPGAAKPKGPRVPSRRSAPADRKPGGQRGGAKDTTNDRPSSRTPDKDRERRRDENDAKRERDQQKPDMVPPKKPDSDRTPDKKPGQDADRTPDKKPDQGSDRAPDKKPDAPKDKTPDKPKKKETEAPKRTKPRKPKSLLGRAFDKVKGAVKSALKKVRNAGRTLGKKLRKSKVGRSLKRAGQKLRERFKRKRTRTRDQHGRSKVQKRDRDDRKRKDQEKESKAVRLQKAVDRIRPKLAGLLRRGIPRQIFPALLAGMRSWYRLTGLDAAGARTFDVVAWLNPKKKANSGRWKKEYGGEGRRKQVQPRTDPQGERYGEDIVGPATYRSLPAEVKSALKLYTNWSYPYNLMDRGMSAEQLLRDFTQHPLRELFGKGRPTLNDIYGARGRTDLTHDQEALIRAITRSADMGPQEKLDDILRNYKSIRHERLEQHFGGKLPTADQLRGRMRLLDRGTASNRLPHGVMVHRALQSLDFMSGYRGNPHALRGTTQVQRGFMSGSLGEQAAYPDSAYMSEDEIREMYRYRLHLDVPAGSRGVWLGVSSEYPDQRELIQPRGTKYRITDVNGPDRPGPTGVWDIYAKVIYQ